MSLLLPRKEIPDSPGWWLKDNGTQSMTAIIVLTCMNDGTLVSSDGSCLTKGIWYGPIALPWESI